MSNTSPVNGPTPNAAPTPSEGNVDEKAFEELVLTAASKGAILGLQIHMMQMGELQSEMKQDD